MSFRIDPKRSTAWADYSRITCLRCGQHQDFAVNHGDPNPGAQTTQFRADHQDCPGKQRKPMKVWRRPDHTKEDDAHLTKVAALGCLCCRMDGRGYVPASVHHIRETQGMGQRADHDDTLPLCEGHHQGLLAPADPTKIALHRNYDAWVARYGQETILVKGVNDLIARLDALNPDWPDIAPEILSTI